MKKDKKIADILEVLRALAKLMRVPFEQIEAIRIKKAEERGAFDKKFY